MKWMIAIVALVACGGEGGSRRRITVDELPAVSAATVCAKLFECCTPAEFMEETFGGDTVEECEAFYGGFTRFVATTMNDSIANERIVYHADRVGACYDLIDSASCVEFRSQTIEGIGRCDNAIEPRVSNGGACAEDFDCTSGLCDGESIDFETMAITYGVCAAAPTAGQPCVDLSCAGGLYCESGTCAAPQPDGAPCDDDDACESGGCNGTDIGAGTCGSPETCNGQ